MNRQEIITKIQNDINKFFKSYESIGEDERELLNEIFDDVEKLRQPITLAEFLGWKEDKVYVFDNYKLKISNGSVLYFSKFSSKWEIHIPKNIIDLRKATLEVQE